MVYNTYLEIYKKSLFYNQSMPPMNVSEALSFSTLQLEKRLLYIKKNPKTTFCEGRILKKSKH